MTTIEVNDAFALERHLISPRMLMRAQVQDKIPDQFLDEYFSDGMHEPIGIGRTEKGWFVLGCGMGPTVLWKEWE